MASTTHRHIRSSRTSHARQTASNSRWSSGLSRTASCRSACPSPTCCDHRPRWRHRSRWRRRRRRRWRGVARWRYSSGDGDAGGCVGDVAVCLWRSWRWCESTDAMPSPSPPLPSSMSMFWSGAHHTTHRRHSLIFPRQSHICAFATLTFSPGFRSTLSCSFSSFCTSTHFLSVISSELLSSLTGLAPHRSRCDRSTALSSELLIPFCAPPWCCCSPRGRPASLL